MKKLNNKGFTLIELLAVIVILAIIMVVTIPTVLNSMGNARKNTFETSANTVADWVEKEYSLAMLGGTDKSLGGASTAFGTLCDTTNKYCEAETKTTTPDGSTDPVTTYDNPVEGNVSDEKEFFRAAGVDPDNYSTYSIKVTSGRACVKLGASSSGQFKSVKDNEGHLLTAKSTGCTS